MYDDRGKLHGVAVIDKDLASALLAEGSCRPVDRHRRGRGLSGMGDLDQCMAGSPPTNRNTGVAAGSMGPKVEAARICVGLATRPSSGHY
jgi:hypothetical protein